MPAHWIWLRVVRDVVSVRDEDQYRSVRTQHGRAPPPADAPIPVRQFRIGSTRSDVVPSSSTDALMQIQPFYFRPTKPLVFTFRKKTFKNLGHILSEEPLYRRSG